MDSLPFTIALNKIFRDKHTQGSEDFFIENFKPLKKVIKTLENWRNTKGVNWYIQHCEYDHFAKSDL